jgi:NADH-quinone oxidoreductase subunit N
MLSLTGLPPLAGFWGKLMLFTDALNVGYPAAATSEFEGSLWRWFVALTIVGALNAAISAGYYLRIVAVIYFRPATARPEARGGAGAAWAMATCALVVLGVGCYPGPAIERANRASRSAQATYQGPVGQAAVAPDALRSDALPPTSPPPSMSGQPKLADR